MAGLLDRQLLRTWEERFELPPTNTYRVRRAQVENTYNRPYRLIGYCHGDNTLYYDSKVTEETIIHELLHKKNPDWSEAKVRKETKMILALMGGQSGS